MKYKQRSWDFKKQINRMKSQYKDTPRAYTPNTLIQSMYNTPSVFFESLTTSITQATPLMDETDTSIIDHYLINLQTHKEEALWFNSNFVNFFSLLKNNLTVQNRNSQTFLHIYSMKTNKIFILKLFLRLVSHTWITDNLILRTNKSGEYFYDFIFLEMKHCFNKIVNHDDMLNSYWQFFLCVQEKFPSVYRGFPKEYKVIMEEAKWKMRNFTDMIKPKSNDMLNIVNVITQMSLVDSRNSMISELFYYKDLDLNVLNCWYSKVEPDVMICLIENLLKLGEPSVPMLKDHCYYIWEQGKINEAYAKCLAKVICKDMPIFGYNKKNGMNLFHVLFKNKVMTIEEVITIYNILCASVYRGSEFDITQDWNMKDKYNSYPMIYWLDKINFSNDKESAFIKSISDKLKWNNDRKKLYPVLYWFTFVYRGGEEHFKFLFNIFFTKNWLSLKPRENIEKKFILKLTYFSCLTYQTLTIVLKYVFKLSNITEDIFQKIGKIIAKNIGVMTESTILDVFIFFREHSINLSQKYSSIENKLSSYISESYSEENTSVDYFYQTIKSVLTLIICNHPNISTSAIESILYKSLDMVSIAYTFLFISQIIDVCFSKEHKLFFQAIKDSIPYTMKKLKILDEQGASLNYLKLAYTQLQLHMLKKVNKYKIDYYLTFITVIDSSDIKCLLPFQDIIYEKAWKDVVSPTKQSPDNTCTTRNRGKTSWSERCNISRVYLIIALTSFLDYDNSTLVFEDMLLKISSIFFNDYYNIVRNLDDIKNKYKILSFMEYTPKFTYKNFNTDLLGIIYSLILKYLKDKYHKELQHFIKIVYKVESLASPGEITKLRREIIKNVIYFIPILQNNDFSLEQEMNLLSNYILGYKDLIVTNPQHLSDLEIRIRDIILYLQNFIDNTNDENFYLEFIKSRKISSFYYETYSKDDNENWINMLLKLQVYQSKENKQLLISFFYPTYFSVNQPVDFWFDDNNKFINMNIFSFLVYCTWLDDSDAIEQYKTIFLLISKDKRLMEGKVQYEYCAIAELQRDLETIKSPTIFERWINNLNILWTGIPSWKDLLSQLNFLNQSLCFILSIFMKTFRKSKCKSKEKLIEIWFSKTTGWFKNYHISRYSFNFLIEIIALFTTHYHCFFDLDDRNSPKYPRWIPSKIFSVALWESMTDYNQFILLLTSLCVHLSSLPDWKLFDEFVNELVAFTSPLLKKAMNSESTCYWKYLLWSYSIYNDNESLFSHFFHWFNYDKIEDILLYNNESYSNMFEFKYIAQMQNPFTKFLNKNKRLSLYLLALAASSEWIFNYLLNNFFPEDLVKQKIKTTPAFILEFKNIIFLSKNINYILEYKYLFDFKKDNTDYDLICRNYNNKTYFGTYIQSFMSVFKKDHFNKVKLFIMTLVNDANEIGQLIFNELTNDEKEQLLHEVIPNTDNERSWDIPYSKPNILHYLVVKNYHVYLKDLLKIIKEKNKWYGNWWYTNYKIVNIYLKETKQGKTQIVPDDDNEYVEYEKWNQMTKESFDAYYLKRGNRAWYHLYFPIKYAILYKSFHCFALLMDYYPCYYITHCFKDLHINYNVTPYDTRDYESTNNSIIFSYLLFFKNEENKMLVKNYNPTLFLLSESIVCINESIVLNKKRIINQKLVNLYYNLFGFIIGNPTFFWSDSWNDDWKNFFLKSSNNTQTFQVLHIWINVLKIYPHKSWFSYFFSEKFDFSAVFWREEPFLYLLKWMEEEGFRIVNCMNYLPKNYGFEYWISDIERIKIMKDYDKLISYKSKYYVNAEEIQSKFSKDSYQMFIKCIVWDFHRIAYMLYKEHNLLEKFVRMDIIGRQCFQVLLQFQGFKWMFLFDNYDEINEHLLADRVKRDVFYSIDTQEKRRIGQQYTAWEEVWKKRFLKNINSSVDYDNELDDNVKLFISASGHEYRMKYDLIHWEENQNQEDKTRDAVLKVPGFFRAIAPDFIRQRGFNKHWYHNLDFNYKGVEFDYLWIWFNFKSYISTNILFQGRNYTDILKEMRAILLMYTRVFKGEDKFLNAYFDNNPMEELLDRILSNINMKEISEYLYRNYVEFSYGDTRVSPEYMKDFYDLYFKQPHVEEQQVKIKDEVKYYMRFFKTIKLYVDYWCIYIDNIDICLGHHTAVSMKKQSRQTRKPLRIMTVNNKENDEIYAKYVELFKTLGHVITFKIKIITGSDDKDRAEQGLRWLEENIVYLSKTMFRFLSQGWDISKIGGIINLTIPCIYNITKNWFCEVTTNSPVNHYIPDFMNKIQYFMFIKHGILFEQFMYNINNYFPSNGNYPQVKNKLVKSSSGSKVIDRLRQTQSRLKLFDYMFNYVHSSVSSSTAPKLEDLYQEGKDNNTTQSPFYPFIELYFGHEILEYIKTDTKLYRLLFEYLLNKNNYPIVNIEELLLSLVKNKNTRPSEKLKYSLIHSKGLKQFDHFCNNKFLIFYFFSWKFKSMFKEGITVHFDYISLNKLLESYIAEDILYKWNKQFTNSNKVKDKLILLFNKACKERLFIKENSWVTCLALLVDSLNNALEKEGKSVTEYSICFNDTLISGLTIEYFDVDSINNLMEIDTIQYEMGSERSVLINVKVSCCQFKTTGSEDDMVKTLQTKSTDCIPMDKELERWYKSDYVRKVIEEMFNPKDKKNENDNEKENLNQNEKDKHHETEKEET